MAYAFNEKTVLRAGVGRFFTRLGVSDSVFLGGNPPFQPIVSVSNGSVDNPGGGSSQHLPAHRHQPGSRSSRTRRPGRGT